MLMGWKTLQERVRTVFSDEDLQFQVVKRVPNVAELFDRIIACYKIKEENGTQRIIMLPGDYHRIMLLGMLLPYFVVEGKFSRSEELLSLYVDALQGLQQIMGVPQFMRESLVVLERFRKGYVDLDMCDDI